MNTFLGILLGGFFGSVVGAGSSEGIALQGAIHNAFWGAICGGILGSALSRWERKKDIEEAFTTALKKANARPQSVAAAPEAATPSEELQANVRPPAAIRNGPLQGAGFRLTVFLLLLAGIGGGLVLLKNPQELPRHSLRLGDKIPDSVFPPLEGLLRNGKQIPGVSSLDFSGHVSVVYFWSSWYVGCLEDLPRLLKLSADMPVRIVGVSYKDVPEAAIQALQKSGNPFTAVGSDASGKLAIDWSVFSTHDTFVIGRDQRATYRVVGSLNDEAIETLLKPKLSAALRAAGD